MSLGTLGTCGKRRVRGKFRTFPRHCRGASSLEKCTVYGGFDGLMAAGAVIGAGAALGLPHSQLLALALTVVCCLALAIAWRTYLRFTSDATYYARERSREQWELENFPAGEVTEMVELCESMGVAHRDAETAMTALAKYEGFFVDLMMVLELRMQIPDYNPLTNALAAGGAFATFGCLPCAALLLYAHTFHSLPEQWALFGPACALATGLLSTALLVGVKSRLLPHRSVAWAGSLAFAAAVSTIAAAHTLAPALLPAVAALSPQ